MNTDRRDPCESQPAPAAARAINRLDHCDIESPANSSDGHVAHGAQNASDAGGAGSGADVGTDDQHANAVAAMLPAQLLESGEIIILLLKPSLWFILLTCLGYVTMVVIGFIIALQLQRWELLLLARRDLVLITIGLLGARLFWQFFEWLSRVYVLTDRRVIRVEGVIRVRVFECQLQQVQHTTMFFSLRERLLGLGTIGFATAGTGITEAVWQMLANPLDVHQTVIKTLSRYRR